MEDRHIIAQNCKNKKNYIKALTLPILELDTAWQWQIINLQKRDPDSPLLETW